MKSPMQPAPPASFPRRIKRFESLSMTPLDYQNHISKEIHVFTPVNSFKAYFRSPNKIPAQQNYSSNLNSISNQFSFKERKRIQANNNFYFKSSQKVQIETKIKQIGSVQKILGYSHYQKQRKFTAREILETSPKIQKKFLLDDKLDLNQRFNLRNASKNKIQIYKMKSQCAESTKKDKKQHIPSFLLKKKKSQRFSEIPDSNRTPQKQKNKLRTLQLKNQTHLFQKIIPNQVSANNFKPPTVQKLFYSKATASTICSNLPLEEGRKTLRDFDEAESKKSINYTQQNPRDSQLQKDLQRSSKKEEKSIKISNNFQDEIAELFSDENTESQQFDESLQKQLEQLF